MNFSKKEKTAQVNGLLTEDGLEELLEGKNCYALDIEFPFVVSFIEKRIGFERNCDLTRMNV